MAELSICLEFGHTDAMGVQGLLGTCLRRQDECTEIVDLIEIAAQRQGIEILVDFYSFQHCILSAFWAAITKLRGNFYLRILGGEYKSLRQYITRFIEALKEKGISLVFYVDGSRGSSQKGLDQKIDTWLQRTSDDVAKLADILEVCHGSIDMVDLPEDTKIRPVVLEDEVISTVKQCGCELHQCPVGEADIVIAKSLRDRQHAFAILSNDTDFCVTVGGRFIPFELFDIDKDMRLGEPMVAPSYPRKLRVKVITCEKVISMLQLQNHSQLVEMSIVAGNDYTRPYMVGYLQHQLDVRGRKSIENFAGWIRHYKYVNRNEVIRQEMQRNPGFSMAVLHSREFYSLQLEYKDGPKKGYYTQLLEEGISAGKYPCFLMGFHNNFCWYRVMLEDNSPGQQFAESALIPLRTYVYRIVLPRHETEVVEHGVTPQGVMVKRTIYAAPDGSVVPLHKIVPDKIFNNLRAFHMVMSHNERGNCTTNWFDRYGRKNGFIIYLLRYFLFLTWGRYLYLTENEFLALVVLVFGRPDETKYQSIPIRPTVRCVTIFSWFQNVYRHAYAMLGSLFHLKHEFPLPSEMFSGAVWTAIFMVSSDRNFYQASQQAPRPFLEETQQHMNQVLTEKRHIIRHVVEGFFQYE